jgi:GLPGLI family protein
MKKILCYIALMACSGLSFGQFATQGKIVYERKTNLKLQLQTDDDNEWVKSMINKIAQYTISDFVMTFNKEGSEYEFEKEREVTGMTFSWGGKPGRENKVYTNFKTGRLLAQKNVYENDYLVDEAQPVFQWKIMDEMRNIAGYPCRKAITRICDSVVVVAYYSDQIIASGGPEGFNGLPGMILGLAVPRLYTTWFATNVDILPQEVTPFKPLKKSKKVNNEGLLADLKKGTKDWGKYGANLVWWLSL